MHFIFYFFPFLVVCVVSQAIFTARLSFFYNIFYLLLSHWEFFARRVNWKVFLFAPLNVMKSLKIVTKKIAENIVQ